MLGVSTTTLLLLSFGGCLANNQCAKSSGRKLGSGKRYKDVMHKSAGQCCTACQKDPKCKSFTYFVTVRHHCYFFANDNDQGPSHSGHTSYRRSAAPTPGLSWPSFANAADLQKDMWAGYYKAVYGQIPDKGYPISPKSLWTLYSDALIEAGVTSIPALQGECPSANPPEGQRYIVHDTYVPPGLTWIWHPYPYNSLSANLWAEVLHKADPFGDEHFGAWFVYSPGSAIYFNLGSTISFAEHQDAYNHFGITSGSFNEEMSKAAAAQGLDSVQFVAHIDHVNYQCDTHNTGHAGLDYMGLEIVGVKLVGLYACAATAGAPPTIKVGWQASKTCVCDNKKEFLNCVGAPSDQHQASSVNDTTAKHSTGFIV